MSGVSFTVRTCVRRDDNKRLLFATRSTGREHTRSRLAGCFPPESRDFFLPRRPSRPWCSQRMRHRLVRLYPPPFASLSISPDQSRCCCRCCFSSSCAILSLPLPTLLTLRLDGKAQASEECFDSLQAAGSGTRRAWEVQEISMRIRKCLLTWLLHTTHHAARRTPETTSGAPSTLLDDQSRRYSRESNLPHDLIMFKSASCCLMYETACMQVPSTFRVAQRLQRIPSRVFCGLCIAGSSPPLLYA